MLPYVYMSDFEWDEDKNKENQIKHGVSFEEAQQAFFDPHLRLVRDADHSQIEERWYCLGKVTVYRDNKPLVGVLTVRFTYRDNKIRIIGAGFWRKGKARYAEKRS